MSNKDKSISAKALDSDKLEDVSGGATIYKTDKGDLIALSLREQHLLKMLNFDINPADSSGGELFAEIKNKNGKSYSPEEISSRLSQYDFGSSNF